MQAASDAAPQQRPALGLPWPATAQEPPVGPDRYNGQPSLQLQLHLQLQLQRRCPLRPRLRLQPLPRLRRWRRHRGGRGLRQRPAVRAAPRPLRSHPPSLSSRSQGIQGGSASAVFSAARFLFPFESLSYTIYEYGIGALYAAPRVAGLAEYSAVYHPSTARPGDPTPAVAVPPLDARAAWRGGARSPSPRAPSDRCGARVPSLLSRPAWRCPCSTAARATPPTRRSLAALPEPPERRIFPVRRTRRSDRASLLISSRFSSMSILPRFTTRAATDERIKVCLQKREPQRTHARSVLVCWCFLGQGGSEALLTPRPPSCLSSSMILSQGGPMTRSEMTGGSTCSMPLVSASSYPSPFRPLRLESATPNARSPSPWGSGFASGCSPSTPRSARSSSTSPWWAPPGWGLCSSWSWATWKLLGRSRPPCCGAA